MPGGKCAEISVVSESSRLNPSGGRPPSTAGGTPAATRTGRWLEVTGAGYAPEGKLLANDVELAEKDDAGLRALLEAAALCNDAQLVPPDKSDPRWRPLGDPTEAALLNCRSELKSALNLGLVKNPWLLGGLVLANLLQCAVIYTEPMNRIFHTVPIPLADFFLIGAVASLVLWVEEARKFWARLRSPRAMAESQTEANSPLLSNGRKGQPAEPHRSEPDGPTKA